MKQNIKNSARDNGLIIGALLSVKFLLSTQNSTFFALFAITISVSIILVIYRLGVKFRDYNCEGSISSREAFSFVFQVYMYGAVISSLVLLMYCLFIDNTFPEKQLNYTLLMYNKLSIEVDENMHKMLITMYKTAPLAIMNLVTSAIPGAFWGLILAVFLKKDKYTLNNEQ